MEWRAVAGGADLGGGLVSDVSTRPSNAVFNSAYDEPGHHFHMGSNGPTGKAIELRRPSEFFIPMPRTS